MTRRSDGATDSLTASTITALLAARAEHSPSGIGQWSLDGEGRWESMTWAAMQARVGAIACSLRAQGLQPGQRVAIMAAGSPAWDQVHLGVLCARGVVVGLDTHASAAQLEAMFVLVQPHSLVVDDLSALDGIRDDVLASLRCILVLAPNGRSDLGRGRGRSVVVTLSSLPVAGRSEDLKTWDEAMPDDPAWIIFTSGTSGQPKGLLYRHRQVRLAVDAILEAFSDITEADRLVSWLPLSNPFQRIINLSAMACGAQTYYVSDPREVMKHLPTIRPHVFIGVPRFYEKFHAGALTQLQRLGFGRYRIAHFALQVGERHAALQRAGRTPPATMRLAHRVADAVVLGRIRAAFGGELRYLVSGSAAMPEWLLSRLHGMGLLVLEAYGLSECIVPVAANRAGAYRFGSVGRPMSGNEIRLAADGELLLRSDAVFGGYLASTTDDASAVDAEGFLATGDYAKIDADGFIHLVGRKSEVFKTSTGRRVAPGAVESVLRSVPGVEYAAVFGAGRKSLLAVVSLGYDGPAIPEALRDATRRALESLPDYLRPAGLVVSRRPFTIEAGELTGNLKLRRHRVGQRYAAALKTLAAAVDEPASEQGRTLDAYEPDFVDLVLL